MGPPRFSNTGFREGMPVRAKLSRAQVRALERSLKESGVLAAVDPAVIPELIDSFLAMDVEPGASLDISDAVGVVVAGTASVVSSPGGGAGGGAAPPPATSLEAGETFGTDTLLLAYPQDGGASSKLTASAACTICVLPHASLASALERGQRARLAEAEQLLRSMAMCARMTPAERLKIAAAMRTELREPGERVIVQGQAGDTFYVVKEGELDVTRLDDQGGDVVIDRRSVGDHFGEAALLNDQPRNATVVCKTACCLLSLGKEAFLRLLGPLQAILARGEEDLRRSVLQHVSLLSSLAAAERQQLVVALDELHIAQGEVIFRDGDESDRLFIVQQGEVEVALDGRPATIVSSGAHFGWPFRSRRETAVASSDCVILGLARELMEQVLAGRPDFRRLAEHRQVAEETRDLSKLLLLRRLHRTADGSAALHLVSHAHTRAPFALRSAKRAAHASSARRARLLRERLARDRLLPHPLISSTYNSYQDEGRLYLLTELCIGGTVDGLVHAAMPCAEREAAVRSALACAVSALCALHRQCVVYRSLRPATLRVDHRGRGRLVDFTYARCEQPLR